MGLPPVKLGVGRFWRVARSQVIDVMQALPLCVCLQEAALVTVRLL
jgi:hypothetical protein